MLHLFWVSALWLALPVSQESLPQKPHAPRLSELAKSVRLQLPPNSRKLDNETVKRLGREPQAKLPNGTNPAREHRVSSAQESWTGRYQEARGRVLGLQLLVERLQRESDRCQGQCPQWTLLGRSLKRAKLELELMKNAPSNVIREAVAAGGKAEWFAKLPTPEPIYPSWVVPVSP